ncbi:MAG: hemolysin III family protein, partial [Candidatus Dechloromonas phosphoritropha]
HRWFRLSAGMLRGGAGQKREDDRQRMYHGEKFNAWTHLVGALLALGGAVWLLVLAAASGDWLKIFAIAVYGTTLVLLYSISTIYHSVRGRAKRVMRKLDHLSIYLLIAGSYTPFCLITLRGPWGWSLFGIVWTLALIGMLQEIKPRSEARVMSLVIYAVMGWIVLVAVNPLLASLGAAGFIWLAAGGVLYTVGIIFFVFDERFRHWHGIWHLFVIAGSLMHFIAILFYVL